MSRQAHHPPPDDGRPVLVTGGAGFIGSHLVALLVAQNRPVRVFELPDAATHHLPVHIEIVRGDLRRERDVREAVHGCGLVLHLAANPNLWSRDPDDFDRVNHRGTLHVLAAAEAERVARVVHVSTESILATLDRDEVIDESRPLKFEEMIGPYCRSKYRAETAAMEAAKRGVPVVVASPTVPVGPGDRRRGPLSRLICDFAAGRIKAYLDGEINVVDVRDAAAGVWAAAERGRVGRRYLLAGETWTIPRLFEALGELTGVEPPRRRVSYGVALAYAWLEEQWCRLSRERVPQATVTGVMLTRRGFRFDPSVTWAELGITPRPCLDALREAVRWFEREGMIEVER